MTQLTARGLLGPRGSLAGGRAEALAIPCTVPRAVTMVALRWEGALHVDVVIGQAVEALANELRWNHPRTVRPHDGAATLVTTALD